MNKKSMRARLLASSMICGAAFMATSAFAADATDEATTTSELVVTGSRIARQDYVANSPIATVTGEQIIANADVTLDTYLNTLPQVNPAGTTTSNNPGNNGQSNIDLRGFGANRNVVLIDGRRAMVSSNLLTVDLNTIPQALIDSIEVITGGAGSAYGADAIAGAVNVKLKHNFEGIDFRANYSNSTEFWDAEEYQFSVVVGGNFADGRGNAAFAFDRSYREGMIKSQRDFSSNATSTTSFLPEGALFWANANAPSKAALDAIFAGYGVPGTALTLSSGTIGFNLDGTLFYKGIFNSPFDVQHYTGPIDGSVNQNLYPDLYSYNFDFVNILTLPLDRYSFMTTVNYKWDSDIEVFASGGWTEYTSTTALAPTPFPTVNTRNPLRAGPTDVASGLVINTCPTAANPNAACQISQQLVIPVTNPFIPADLLFLLNSRVGDDLRLVGAGAGEPFLMRQRTLDIGLRKSIYENTVVQFMGGVRGPIPGTPFSFEASIQHGRTEIDQTQTGNLNTQRMQQMVEAADGGQSLCAGGFNIFGRQPISPECVDFLEVATTLSTAMYSDIAQGWIEGPIFTLPAGEVKAVLGAEYRGFEYTFDPGSASGPISGFNTQNPEGGSTSFKDIFGEMLIPLVKDAQYARSIEVNLGARRSWSEFHDEITGTDRESRGSWAYKAELTWDIVEQLRLRASYQRSVREPNFSELFAGGGSAPQYFDPCSVTSDARTGSNAAQIRQLCLDAGFNGGVNPAAIDNYVQTPGSQIGVDLAGNLALNPEIGKTFTVGLVWKSPWDSPWLSRLQGSIDYWNIKIDQAILTPTPNQIVAACFNYYGTNSSYDPNDPNCLGILRTGTDILWVYNPATDFAEFIADNGGWQHASGIDFQFDYGWENEWLGLSPAWGSVRINALVSYNIEWKQQDPFVGSVPLDFSGTVSYFGAGLGTSFPKWKATINTAWTFGDFTLAGRGRYIGPMDNRLDIEFPGETEFTGTDPVFYVDLTGTWRMTDWAELKLGVNNVFDTQPQIYAPNVQSGTDPSTYDVIGRRVVGGIKLRF